VPGPAPDPLPAPDPAPAPAPARRRCPWPGVDTDPLYAAYHDDEWGRPVHGSTALFERLSLEAFQSGLSWVTILRKRPAFRSAFAGFEPAVLAGWGTTEVDRLLGDAGIVRNRRKIDAVLTNARVIADTGLDLDELLWSFARPAGSRPRRPAAPADVPAATGESAAMARELRRRGIGFVGPTTAYALMQATGMVDDHVLGCWLAATGP